MFKNVISFVLVLLFYFGFAQKKNDRIIKKDYSVIDCSVSKISDASVDYTLAGEKVTYSLDKSKIAKIEFANGRSEVFATENNQDTEAEGKNSVSVMAAEMKTNTVAVLPIPFINSETMETSAEMAKLAQNDVYNILQESAANIAPLNVQDVRITNSLLKKAGVDYTNIDETPIEDLQKILGVDHIVSTKVSYTIKINKSTYSSGNADVKVKNDNEIKGKNQDFSSTSENKSYDFLVYFDLYKNTDKIYSKTREPFLMAKNSWKDSLEYLLRRAPIFKK